MAVYNIKEQPIIANGGLQYMSSIAAAMQYVYLDFDGELTSYNGELLTVDNVKVQDSALTQERIADILSELNTKYASQNVIFVTERPTTTEYSTIYIGKTSAFDPYGNFAGLAETIDSGNKNKTDKAFVMLDSTATDYDIISTISHETDHLLGTLDHGGEGLEAYADHYYYYNNTYTGVLNRNLTLWHNSVNYVSWWLEGGDSSYYYYDKATNVTIVSGGRLYVSSGATATNITLNSGGSLYVSSGATATNITLNPGGSLFVSSGTTATNITLNSGGSLRVEGGTATNITLNSGGRLSIKKGGTATDVIVSGGSLFVSSGTTATNITLNSGGSLRVEGGTATDVIVSGGSLRVEGGTATDVIVSGGAIDNYGSGSMTIGDYAVFSGNSGRAIDNDSGSMTIGDSVVFAGNSACNYYGVAIRNGGSGSMSIGDSAVFSGNSGGAIFNGGSMSIGDSAVFSGNVANGSYGGNGGAIFNRGSMSIGDSAVFIGNSASGSYGGCCGAIRHYGGSISIGDSAVFIGNSAFYEDGGAIYNNHGSMSIGDSAVFSGNVASGSDGGAIYNYGSGSMTIGGSAVFIGNSAYRGGAIYNNYYGSMSIGDSAVFTGNSGGAICNGGSGSMSIGDNAVFSGNSGGAIDNNYSMSIGDNAVFSGNVAIASGNNAVAYGGAIYNRGSMTIGDNTVFATHTDTIYNCGNIILNGDVSFAGNITLADTYHYRYGTLQNNGNMDFNISVRVEDDGLLLDDWEQVSGDGTYSITVDNKQVSGEYQLIGNAANFNKTITVRNEDGSKKGELSLDMEEPLELRNMSLMLKLDEETNIISVIVDSEYSESTDREKQETQITLPEDAFAGMSYNDYTIKQAPDWLTIDPSTGKFSGTTGKITDTATGYGTTEVIITATKGEDTKEHTIDVVVVPENIEGDGAIKDSPNANMTDLIADAVSRRDQHSSEPSLLAWMPFPQDKKFDWNYCGLDITLSGGAYGITVTDTDYIISVQGKIALSIFDSQKSEDDRAGLQVDLSGKKYIKITTPHDFKSAKFDIVGDLTYQNLTLADGFFLKEGVISVDTEKDKWAGTADIEFTYFDKALKAEYVVVKKQVDTLTLKLSGLDIAVGATGFFLKSVNGGVRNFSDGDDKPSEIVAGVGLYYGKQISIGGNTYSLATIDADVTITNKNITGSGDIEVLGGLVSGDVSLTVDWKEASLTANGKVTLANLLTSQGALKIDLNGNVAFATAGVIDFSEYGLGFTMNSNVLLKFSNDNNNANDYYAAWSTQEFCGIEQSLGVRFSLDGSWQLLGTEKVKKINENDNPITYSLRRSRSILPVTESWDLSGTSGIVLISAQWESGETEFLLTDGNGNTYTKEDIAKRSDMEIVENMSNDKALVIAVKDPVEGIWSLSIANGTNVEIDANILNGKSSVAAPTLTAEAGNGRDITVSWNCPELPENAELCIYYDTDSSGNDGVLLTQINPDKNSGSYTWTVPDALAGELRFYAVLSSPDLLPAVGTYTSAIAMEAKAQLVEVTSGSWNYADETSYTSDAKIVSGGVLELDGGTASGTTSVASGGEIILANAGISGSVVLGGIMTVRDESNVSKADITFDLSERNHNDDYMVNDLSRLSGAISYSITISSSQKNGEYKLAQGASSFTGSITVTTDTETDLGTLSVGGKLTANGDTYALSKENGALHFYVNPIVSSGGTSSGGIVSSGGTSSGGIVSSGGTSSGGIVSSGGTSSGGIVSSGGTSSGGIVSSGGGTSSGGIVSSGGTSSGGIVSSGGTSSGGIVSSGGTSSGGIVSSGTTSSGGIVSSGGTSSGGIVVNSGKNVYVYNGEVITSATINRGGNVILSSGGAANVTTINAQGGLHVYSGATASNTTVKQSGYLGVGLGATTYNTTIDYAGELTVWGGGKVYNNTINQYGAIILSSGAVADSSVINSQGGLHVYSGAVASNTTVKQKGIFGVGLGATTYNTTIDYAGELKVWGGGKVYNNTINEYGAIILLSGAMADTTTINSQGGLHVYSGAVASNTTVKQKGIFGVGLGATTYNTLIDYAGELKVWGGGKVYNNTINQYGAIILLSGAMADTTTINSQGGLHVYSGAVASNTTVKQGGFFGVGDGATTYNTLIDYAGELTVWGGGLVNDNKINQWGAIILSSGAAANRTIINPDGGLHIYNGATAYTTEVTSGAKLGIGSGGYLYGSELDNTGTMTFYEGAKMGGWHSFEGSVITSGGVDASGAYVNFELDDRTSDQGVILDNIGNFYSVQRYSMEVDADQVGTFRLAAGAASFNDRITLYVEDGVDCGSLAVGESLDYNGKRYSLENSNGILALKIS